MKWECSVCNKVCPSIASLRKHQTIHDEDREKWKCSLCNKEFKTAKGLKEHAKLHDANRDTYPCSFCNRVFKSRKGLLGHKLTHVGENATPGQRFVKTENKKGGTGKKVGKSFVCLICDRKFHTKKALALHVDKHAEEKRKSVCNICNKSFSSPSYLKRHKIYIHEEAGAETVQCRVCNRSFCNSGYLKKHMQYAHEGLTTGNIMCPICDEGFYSGTVLKEHINTAHSGEEKTGVEEKIKTYCNICNKIFCSLTYLRKHKRMAHAENRERSFCPICNKGFCNKLYLKKHQAVVHDGFKPSNKTCPVCNHTFLETCDLRKHVESVHQGLRVSKCPHCNKQISDRYLQQHINAIHKRLKQYQCHLCDKKFIYRRCLVLHVNMHTGEGHKCDICSKVFQNKQALHNHSSVHAEVDDVSQGTSDQHLVCHICGVLVDCRYMKKHMLRHYKTRRHQCDKCGKSYATRVELKAHRKEHTSRPCPVCEKDFRSDFRLKIHLRIHNSKKNFKCSECKQCFGSQVALNYHNKRHSVKSCTYICPTCDKGFYSANKIKAHVEAVHMGLRPHTCSACGKAYGTRADLTRHRLTHSKRFECDRCERRFASRPLLKTHWEKHDKKFSCSFCDQILKSKDELRRHLYSHPDYRPYLCHICGLGFKSKAVLKNHGVKHRDVGIHPCEKCGKVAFKTALRLRFHMQAVHRPKPRYICAYCNKSHISKYHLNCHVRLHTGEKPFSCLICNKRFRRKAVLMRHLVEKHVAVRPTSRCERCSRCFTRASDFKQHLQSCKKSPSRTKGIDKGRNRKKTLSPKTTQPKLGYGEYITEMVKFARLTMLMDSLEDTHDHQRELIEKLTEHAKVLVNGPSETDPVPEDCDVTVHGHSETEPVHEDSDVRVHGHSDTEPVSESYEVNLSRPLARKYTDNSSADTRLSAECDEASNGDSDSLCDLNLTCEEYNDVNLAILYASISDGGNETEHHETNLKKPSKTKAQKEDEMFSDSDDATDCGSTNSLVFQPVGLLKSSSSADSDITSVGQKNASLMQTESKSDIDGDEVDESLRSDAVSNGFRHSLVERNISSPGPSLIEITESQLFPAPEPDMADVKPPLSMVSEAFSDTSNDTLPCDDVTDKIADNDGVNEQADSSGIKSATARSSDAVTESKNGDRTTPVFARSVRNTSVRKKRYTLKKEKGQFKCDLCDFRYYDRKIDLTRHLNRDHGSGRYQCAQCTKSFKRNLDLKHHTNRVHLFLFFKCNICKDSFASNADLQGHRKNCHRNKKGRRKVKSDGDTGDLLHICAACGWSFETERTRDVHAGRHRRKGHKCPVCDEAYYQSVEVKAHLEKVHSDSSLDVCPICSDPLTPEKWKDHVIEHINSNNPYDCYVCKASFAMETALFFHMKKVNEARSKCDVCLDSFDSCLALTEHANTHGCRNRKTIKNRPFWAVYLKKRCEPGRGINTGGKTYICDVCGHTTGTSRGIKLHKKWHTDSKIWKIPPKQIVCEYCSKIFTRKCSLFNHIVAKHRGEAEYQYVCETCGKKFSYRCNLYRHLFTHKAAKRFSCSLCWRTFTQKTSLENHMLVHMGIKPHSCETCGKSFTQKSNLRTHMKRCKQKIC